MRVHLLHCNTITGIWDISKFNKTKSSKQVLIDFNTMEKLLREDAKNLSRLDLIFVSFTFLLPLKISDNKTYNMNWTHKD